MPVRGMPPSPSLATRPTSAFRAPNCVGIPPSRSFDQIDSPGIDSPLSASHVVSGSLYHAVPAFEYVAQLPVNLTAASQQENKVKAYAALAQLEDAGVKVSASSSRSTTAATIPSLLHVQPVAAKLSDPHLPLLHQGHTIPILSDSSQSSTGSRRNSGSPKNASGSLLPQTGKATLFVSSFNMACNLIGSGMLAMPWTLKESSLVSGAVFLMMMCLFNGVTMIALAKCCESVESQQALVPRKE